MEPSISQSQAAFSRPQPLAKVIHRFAIDDQELIIVKTEEHDKALEAELCSFTISSHRYSLAWANNTQAHVHALSSASPDSIKPPDEATPRLRHQQVEALQPGRPEWPRPSSPDSGVASLLTARELQIAALVAMGHSNKQISKSLQISQWTVGSHLQRIFLKLGVDSRAAMVFRCASLLGAPQ